MNAYHGSPMTLGNAAAARVRLIVWCLDCHHQAEPHPAEMAERYGAEMPCPGLTCWELAKPSGCTPGEFPKAGGLGSAECPTHHLPANGHDRAISTPCENFPEIGGYLSPIGARHDGPEAKVRQFVEQLPEPRGLHQSGPPSLNALLNNTQSPNLHAQRSLENVPSHRARS